MQLIPYAKLGRPKGLKGHLFLRVYNPDTALLVHGQTFYLDDEKSLCVDEVQSSSKGHVVKFKEIGDVKQAKGLNGRQLHVTKDQLPQLQTGAHYHIDLIGLEVKDPDGQDLGVLKQIMVGAMGDVFVVESNKEEILYPRTHFLGVKDGKIAMKKMEYI